MAPRHKYEHPLHQEFRASAPRTGLAVDTPQGPGTVVGHNVPSDSVIVRLNEGGRRCACSKASVCSPRKQHDAMYGDAQAVAVSEPEE
ncbi:hypothetical protein AB0L30_29175 [Microbispora rosea]|uniref:hypothetical protein n=1 Tax=Microbispora rosea TaxID=58117 RepID=UPI003412ED97